MSVHPWTELPALMDRLDACLAAAVPQARIRYGVGPGTDPYRGLYIGDEQVERLVAQPLDGVGFGTAGCFEWPELRPPAGYAQLDPFETAVAVLALAPEIDLKYERVYGYLQDDVNARRPTVALALDLFCPDLQARLAGRDRLSPDAPLRSQRFMHLGGTEEMPLLARPVRLDPQMVRYLLAGSGLDERLAEHCLKLAVESVEVPLPLEPADRTALLGYLRRARSGATVRLGLSGTDLPMLAQLTHQLASELDLALLRMPARHEQLLTVLAAESRLLGCAVHVEWSADSGTPVEALQALDGGGALVVVTTDRPRDCFDQLGFDVVEIRPPAAGLRREWWERHAPGRPDAEHDRLAARFRLTGTQIGLAARNAQRSATVRGEPTAFADLTVAARRQSAHRLAALANPIPIMAGWDELVLPANAISTLHELCDRVVNRQTVLRQWGMDQRTNGRLGINALFAGPSGTGKTMAAQVIAGELGLDLFAVDLSGVVSKYIGETEKNLDQIFRAAENTDAVLLFDEADSLFGKRSQVRDSHDRYANLEVSYLLQRMENHDGVALLATNLRQNLDEAFLRRLAFTVRFPAPEEPERRRIWAQVWPASVPMAGDIDLDLLAAQYKFSGGNIRNVAVCAAYLAAARGRSVTFDDVLDAVDREYDKLGATSAPRRAVAALPPDPGARALSPAGAPW